MSDVDDTEARELRRYLRGYNDPIEEAIRLILHWKGKAKELQDNIDADRGRAEDLSPFGKDTCG